MVRITGLSILLVAFCALFAAPVIAETEWDWTLYKFSCLKKDWRIVNAIDALCNKNIHMPGADASMGVSFDGGRNSVSVSAAPQCWSDVLEDLCAGKSEGQGS
ncbi:hypothetical protein E4T44_11334 [Aureobasidium sp. EXF-8845]|nr:hypothetical protein E4T45_11241 [Aureobasidium sp. EXF-8846]KAI4805000.1 hypothetical protein E4T44_11334 [Aureobasidium sp. EXF-8845]